MFLNQKNVGQITNITNRDLTVNMKKYNHKVAEITFILHYIRHFEKAMKIH